MDAYANDMRQGVGDVCLKSSEKNGRVLIKIFMTGYPGYVQRRCLLADATTMKLALLH